MRNIFRPFGVKAIASFKRQLKVSRLILTLFYVLVLCILLFSANGITRTFFSMRLEQRFEKFEEERALNEGRFIPPPSMREIQADLVETTLYVNLSLLLLVGVLGYIFSGITWRPIQESYDMQRNFFSNASHEFRTPLAILYAGLQRGLKKAETPEQKEAIERHLSEVRRLTALSDQILVLSRAEQDDSEAYSGDPMSLKKAIEACVERLSVLAEDHDVLLRADINDSKDVLLSTIDELSFDHVLSNIVQNAIYYNKEKGTVTLSFKVNKMDVVIEVRDTGEGVSKESLARLTDRFFRAEKSRNRVHGGSGLGLSIVQEILINAGGSIEFESEPEKGTLVRISLPIHIAS